MEKHHVISETQMATVVAISLTIPACFTFPNAMVQAAGRQAILSLLLDFLVLGGAATLAYLFYRHFPDTSLPETCARLLGKWAGKGAALLLLLLDLTLAASIVSHIQVVINNVFLHNMPPYLVILPLLLTVVYATWFDLPVLARLFNIFVVNLVVFFVPLLFLLLPNVAHPEVALPPPDISMVAVVKGAYVNFPLYLGLTFIYWLGPWLRWRTPGHTCRSLAKGVLPLFAFALYLYVVVIGTIGENLTGRYSFPLVQVLRFSFSPSSILPRPGLIILLGLTFGFVSYLTLRIWGAAQSAKLFLGTGSFQPYLLPAGLAVWVLRYHLPRWASYGLMPVGLFLLFVLPLGLILLARHRGLQPRFGAEDTRDSQAPGREIRD